VKSLHGEDLMLLATAVSAELAKCADADEVSAFGDFFSMVGQNLNAIANRRLYLESLNSVAKATE